MVLEAAAAIAGQPAVPLMEQLPLAAVERLAADAGLPSSRDAVGNLLIGQGTELVLVAHLDHPGFAIEGVDAGTVDLDFRGGVRAGVAVPGAAVLLHARGVADPVGRAILRTVDEKQGWLSAAVADVVDGEAPEGGFAVWDVIPYELSGDRITARACDDLLGVAAGLAALVGAGTARASLLCTRGEELGWFGALEAVRLGTVPPPFDCALPRVLADAPPRPSGGRGDRQGR